MSKIAFIINPVSGARKAMKVWHKIEASGLLKDIHHEVHFTGWPGHASLLVRQALEEGAHKIIVVGGDGTLNECVNGYMLTDENTRANASIGIIPYGTGSDWARHHKIPSDTFQALQLCLNADSITHDVGEIKYFRQGAERSRYFVNISTACFGAVAAETANEYKSKGQRGKLVYIKAVLKHLFRYKSNEITVGINDEVLTGKTFLIATGICSSNGSGLKLCPGAVSDDGMFYITHVADISITEVLLNILGLFNGKFIRHPKVNVHKTQHMTVSSDNQEIDIEVDGEYLGKSNCVYIIHPGKLNVLVND